MKEEEKASGIECHLRRLEKALEEIAAAAAEDTIENYRKRTDDAKAAEMRNRGCRKPERITGKAAAFVVQFGVNKHKFFQRLQFCWSWKKIYYRLFIPNCTRNHMITYTKMYRKLHAHVPMT